jgi:hypothetical protein
VLVAFLACAPCAGAWTWPVRGPVLAPFSFDRARPYDAGEHRGIDIGAATGAAVAAPVSGTVSFAGTVPSSGKSLTILTGDALAVTLTHLGSIAVAKGASVAEGDDVGTVGPSGTAEVDGPYVHLGVRSANDEQGYLDPLAFLPPPQRAPEPAPQPGPEPAAQPAPEPATQAAPPAAPAPPVPAASAGAPPAPAPVPAQTVAPPVAAPPAAKPTPAPAIAAAPAAASAARSAPAPAAATSAPASAAAIAPAVARSTPQPSPAPVAPAPSAPVPAVAPVAGPVRAMPAAPVSPAASAPAAAPSAPSPLLDPAAPTPAAVAPPRTVGARAVRRPRGGAGTRAMPVLLRDGRGTRPPAVRLPAPAPTPRRGRTAPPRARVVPASPVAASADRSSPAPLARPAVRSGRRTFPAAAPAASPSRHDRRTPLLVLAGALLAVSFVLALAIRTARVRMIWSPSPRSEGASTGREDPRRTGMAVCERPAPHRPRGGLRRAGGRVRALSPAERRRRPDGQRDGRARHARDGLRRSSRRVAA